jgi:Domain of unknown function (DUF4386)
MTSTRRNAIAAGVLFVVATSASLTATAVLPALTGTDYLAGVADQSGRTAVAALLYLVAAGCSVGIAVALYPVLKGFSSGLAAGSVVFRTVEAVFYTADVVALLSVLSLGQELARTPGADRTVFRTIADALLATRDHAALVAVFAFCVGAFLYYLVFYRSRLVPRWLSGWGIAGVVLMLAACVLALFTNTLVTGYVYLAAPIGLQEFALAAWLIVKGFSPPVDEPSTPRRAGARQESGGTR